MWVFRRALGFKPPQMKPFMLQLPKMHVNTPTFNRNPLNPNLRKRFMATYHTCLYIGRRLVSMYDVTSFSFTHFELLENHKEFVSVNIVT